MLIIQSPAQVITTFGGSGIMGFSGDGFPAVTARMNVLTGMAFDNNGNLFICDYGNTRIRKIDPNGIITTVVGTGVPGYSGDGGPAVNAQTSGPADIAFDVNGNMYFSEFENCRIRKVDVNGIITTFAGTGNTMISGDGGPAISAEIGYPDGIAFDAFGNLYIAQGNVGCVRKIDPSGIISTIAGVPYVTNFNGNGIPAISANLNFPIDVAIDVNGNIFISEFQGDRIRKIESNGIIKTFAGTGLHAYNGDGIAADLANINHPMGIELDAQGNLYILEREGHRIRKVGGNGLISTICGDGVSGYGGDNGPASLARISWPYGVTLDQMGNLYFSDVANYRIRKITPEGVGIAENSTNEINIFPNPFSEEITVNLSDPIDTKFILYNYLTEKVIERNITESTSINTGDIANGVYFYILQNAKNYQKSGKLIKQ